MKMLDFSEYQKSAKTTRIYPDEYALVYPALGLAGEAGEVADKIKKTIRDQHFDRDEIIDELGDVLWYLAAMCDDLGVSLEKVAERNLAKLARRAREKKISGSGDGR